MSPNEYKFCMSQKMGDGSLKGLDNETRRITFCAMAKQCSTGVSREKAMEICRSLPPKEPKERKSRKSKVETCECPPVPDMKKMFAKCEITLGREIGMGNLPEGIDIPGICQHILGVKDS